MKNKGLYDADWINIDGNEIHRTAIIHPNVILGQGNVIGAYCVIGGNGEIRGKDPDDFSGKVIIGDNNIISEFVSIQRPFDDGKSTTIGNNNIIMAHVHIGHDATILSNCEICTGSVIGGYVTIMHGAKIKMECVVRNRVLIGAHSIIGMGSVVTKNVETGAIVYGNPAKPIINTNTDLKRIKHIPFPTHKFGDDIYDWFLMTLLGGIILACFFLWLSTL